MLTNMQIRSIQSAKGINNGFIVNYIQNFNTEWNNATKRIKASGKNLRKIKLIKKHEH